MNSHELTCKKYIHPRYVLEQAGLRQNNDEVSKVVDAEFTMQHAYSLNTLLDPKGNDVNKELVAFVLVQTPFDQGRKGDLRRIPIPEIDKVKIPQEALFLSSRRLGGKSAARRGILLESLQEMTLGPKRDCDLQKGLMCFDAKTSASDWLDSYTEIVKEIRKIPVPASLNVNAVLDDLVHELKIYREKVKEPRLALVLSGSGAKCAYQAGALSAITARLNELRTENPNEWVPEIKLVVGTSGGAINALFYALGIDDKLENTWRSFDQKDLIRPSAGVRILWGIFAGVGCVFIVFLISLVLRTHWWRAMAALLICLALVFLVGANLTIRGLHNHWLYHDILLLRLSFFSACIVLLTAATLDMIRPAREAIHRRILLANLIGGLVVLSMLMLFADIFFFNEYLTDLSGAKEAFISKLPALVPDVHTRVQRSPSADGKLKAISQIITQSSSDLKRDLILTASRLPADDNIKPPDCPSAIAGSSLPNDLYFYYETDLDKREPETLPNKGDRRFISLRENPESLLHVVLGSSTIYPFFDAQRLDCLQVARPERSGPRSSPFGPQQQIRNIDIVDGGYSHNSPLEAAISWGATHILLIQASPSPRYQRPHSLFAHIFNAFNYLFDQAQRADSSVKGSVEIFELSPSFGCDQWFDPRCSDKRQQWLDLLDFSDPLLGSAIEHEWNDVKGQPPDRFLTGYQGRRHSFPLQTRRTRLYRYRDR
jgi:hypothetical protein